MSETIHQQSNTTTSLNSDQAFPKAFDQLDQNRRINIIASIFIIVFGLVSNSTIAFVFHFKKFKIGPNQIYLFYLAIIDASFLIVHLFEDTIRNYNDIFDSSQNLFLNLSNVNSTRTSELTVFINFFNIIDKFDIVCRIVNYLRYVLRFTTAYILLAFTLQRLYMLYYPVSESFKTKSSAWLTIFIIQCFAILMNIWVLFLFEIQMDESKRSKQFCQVKVIWKTEYFQISSFFICIVLLLPIVLLLMANVGILLFISRATKANPHLKLRKDSRFELRKLSSQTQNVSIFRQNSFPKTSHGLLTAAQSQPQQYKRKQLVLKTSTAKPKSSIFINKAATLQLPYKNKIPINRPLKPKFSFKLNSKFFNKSIHSNTTEMMDKHSKKLSLMTILISTSFCLLNLPYLSVWAFFYKELTYNSHLDMATKYSFFSAVQIAEIFFLAYYNLNSFIYLMFKSLFKA